MKTGRLFQVELLLLGNNRDGGKNFKSNSYFHVQPNGNCEIKHVIGLQNGV